MGIIADLHKGVPDKELAEALIKKGYFNEEMLNHLIEGGYLDENMKNLLIKNGITLPSDIVASSSEQLTELSEGEDKREDRVVVANK